MPTPGRGPSRSHQASRPRWREYRTASGRNPVEQYIDSLSERDARSVLGAMADVRQHGLRGARHLEGDIWEVRAGGERVTHRILFAEEGSRGRVLLALEAFTKKTEKTPRATLELAQQRLSDWRSRGAAQRRARERSSLDR